MPRNPCYSFWSTIWIKAYTEDLRKNLRKNSFLSVPCTDGKDEIREVEQSDLPKKRLLNALQDLRH
jgi:hypothetical protein